MPACQSAATPGRSDGAGQRRAQKGRSEPRLLPHQITSAIFTTQDQHLINFGPSTSSICRTRTVVVGIKLSDLRSQDVPLPTGRGCFHVGGVRPAHPIMKREGAKKKKRKKKRGVHPLFLRNLCLMLPIPVTLRAGEGAWGRVCAAASGHENPVAAVLLPPDLEDMRCAPRGQRTVYVHSRS